MDQEHIQAPPSKLAQNLLRMTLAQDAPHYFDLNPEFCATSISATTAIRNNSEVFFLFPLTAYKINEVFEGKNLGTYKNGDIFSTLVNPTGIFLGKATPA